MTPPRITGILTGPERRAAIAAGEYRRRELRLSEPVGAGSSLDVRRLISAGAERDLALDEANRYLDAILDELERVAEAGGTPNFSAAARISGVDRITLIRHNNRRQRRQ